LLPSLFALVVTAIAANVMQTGFMFSTEPLKADFSRMSPVKGFKRVFSMRTVWDLFRLLLKIAILGVVLYALSHSLEGTLLASATRSPADMPALLEESFVRVLKWVLSVLALIAVLDLLFSRREFIQKLRMSRRDMKDEHKRQEGDPAIRSKRRSAKEGPLYRPCAVRRCDRHQPHPCGGGTTLSTGDDARADRRLQGQWLDGGAHSSHGGEPWRPDDAFAGTGARLVPRMRYRRCDSRRSLHRDRSGLSLGHGPAWS
jgi:hypothetical protein